MASLTRRAFGTSAALTAAAYSRVLGANDRVILGFIGVGNRGDQLLDAFLTHKDVNVAAVCDVYEPYRPAAAGKVARGRETTTVLRSWLPWAMAACSVDSSASDTITAWARLCPSMKA